MFGESDAQGLRSYLRFLLKRGSKIAANINRKNKIKIAVPTGSIVYISIAFEHLS